MPPSFDYGDVTMHDVDVETLTGPRWLTDSCIAFAFEHMQRERFTDGRMRFVHPISVFSLGFLEGDDLAEAIEGVGVRSALVSFLPINDNTHAERAGGSHWGLLVYEQPTATFLYYDSCGVGNRRAAHAIAARIWPLLRRGAAAAGPMRFVAVDSTPRQVNSYDCGVYVVAIAEALAQHVARQHHQQPHHHQQQPAGSAFASCARAALHHITPEHVDAARGALLQLVREKEREHVASKR